VLFHLNSSSGQILALLSTAAILHAQPTTLPQEVRVSSRPYTSSAPFVLRAETSLVETGVVVRDQNGRAIGGLTKADFEIFDDGKRREITAFSVETRAAMAPRADSPAVNDAPAVAAAAPPKSAVEPRYVALLFDDVHTSQGDLSHARVAAVRFVKVALHPGDRVAIFTTSGYDPLGFTGETATLVKTIEKLRAHPRMSENGITPCPRITPYQAWLIINLDLTAMQAAVDEAHSCAEAPPSGQPPRDLANAGPNRDFSIQLVRIQAEQTWDQAKVISQFTLDEIQHAIDNLAKMPGSRVLLLASSGFLGGTLEYEQNRIIDRALSAGVVINALDAKGLFADTSARTPDQLAYLTALPMRTQVFEATTQTSRLQEANAPLANLAQSTGGLFFHDNNDLASGFEELAAVPEVTYMLGFRPDDIREGRYHKLSVKFLRKGAYVVQARRGYFAAKATAPPADPRQMLDQEVMADDVRTDFQASVAAEPGKSQGGAPLVWVTVHVDLRNLPFTSRDERHLERITFVTSLLDAQGKLVTAKEGRMDLELTEATLARLLETGVNAKLSLEAPPGSYRLREVVQEAFQGKIAASNHTVNIPR
jgi:VWFA-related protein